jgi:hypothetical protein
MCRSLEQKGKVCFTAKTYFSGTEKFLQKSVFLKKNRWKLLDARDLHIFEKNVKFRFF